MCQIYCHVTSFHSLRKRSHWLCDTFVYGFLPTLIHEKWFYFAMMMYVFFVFYIHWISYWLYSFLRLQFLSQLMLLTLSARNQSSFTVTFKRCKSKFKLNLWLHTVCSKSLINWLKIFLHIYFCFCLLLYRRWPRPAKTKRRKAATSRPRKVPLSSASTI